MTLEGLQAACRDAVEKKTGAEKDSTAEEDSTAAKEFEVGVFNGEYVTGVPEGYFEHLSSVRQQGKKRKAATLELTLNGSAESTDNPAVVTNSGPVYDAGPEYREDIRFV